MNKNLGIARAVDALGGARGMEMIERTRGTAPGYRELVREYGQRRVVRACAALAGARVTTKRDMLAQLRVEIERAAKHETTCNCAQNEALRSDR